MNLEAVVEQLRTHCPSFENRVAGAANFAIGLETTVNLKLPACFVVPEAEEAAEQKGLTGYDQLVTEQVLIIVEFDNRSDRRGQSVTLLYDAMRRELWRALLNWRPPPAAGDTQRAARGFWFGGGQLIDFDRARLFYQWRFCLDITVTDLDGWQEPLDPLEEIDVTRTPAIPPGTSPDVIVTYPQS